MEVDTELMSVAAAARRLGVSEQVLRRMIRAGEIPSIRFGRAYRLRWSSLERWLTQQETGGSPGEGSG